MCFVVLFDWLLSYMCVPGYCILRGMLHTLTYGTTFMCVALDRYVYSIHVPRTTLLSDVRHITMFLKLYMNVHMLGLINCKLCPGRNY